MPPDHPKCSNAAKHDMIRRFNCVQGSWSLVRAALVAAVVAKLAVTERQGWPVVVQ